MRSFTRIAVALSYLCASTVMAHPHVRVAYQVDPVLDASGIRSLQVNWQLDAMTSDQIRENVDLNKNGVLDPDELQAFADGNHDLMKPSQFYLSLEQVDNPTPVPFEVTNYRATDAGFGFQGGVHISFTVNLPASSRTQTSKFVFLTPLGTWPCNPVPVQVSQRRTPRAIRNCSVRHATPRYKGNKSFNFCLSNAQRESRFGPLRRFSPPPNPPTETLYEIEFTVFSSDRWDHVVCHGHQQRIGPRI